MAEFQGRIGHLENIESPWANAGGVAKSVEEVESMAKTGVGWIEAGSFTLEERPDYTLLGEKTYDHNPETGETHNGIRMSNEGIDVVEPQIPEMIRIAHAYNKKLLVNVAPVSVAPVTESIELVSRAYRAGADGVLLNAGCPTVVSTDGRQHEILSQNHKALEQVLNELRRLQKPIMLRISPQETFNKMNKVCGIIHRSGIVSALFVPNSWQVPSPLDEEGVPIIDSPGLVGKSGPAMAGESLTQTAWATGSLRNSKIDVIRSSGIMNAKELNRSFNVDAVAAAGTTFYYESKNGWQEDTGYLLSNLADLAANDNW